MIFCFIFWNYLWVSDELGSSFDSLTESSLVSFAKSSESSTNKLIETSDDIWAELKYYLLIFWTESNIYYLVFLSIASLTKAFNSESFFNSSSESVGSSFLSVFFPESWLGDELASFDSLTESFGLSGCESFAKSSFSSLSALIHNKYDILFYIFKLPIRCIGIFNNRIIILVRVFFRIALLFNRLAIVSDFHQFDIFTLDLFIFCLCCKLQHVFVVRS